MKELKLNTEFLLSKVKYEGFLRISKIDNKRWGLCLDAKVTGLLSGVGLRDQGSCSIMAVRVDGLSIKIKCLPRLYRTVQSCCEVLFCGYES